jgi:hypothetical protein
MQRWPTHSTNTFLHRRCDLRKPTVIGVHLLGGRRGRDARGPPPVLVGVGVEARVSLAPGSLLGFETREERFEQRR